MMKTFKNFNKHIALILFFGFFSLVSAQQTPVKPDKDLEKLINKGLKAYDNANYEDAELSFRKALAKDPMNAVASYNLGLTETELDKSLEAAHFFEKAAKTANDQMLKSKAYFNQGNVWYQKKKYEKAVEAYKNALRNNPGDEEARYNLALAQMKLKKQQKNNKNKNKKNKKNNKQNKQNKNQQNKQNQNKQNQKKDQQNKDNKNNKGQNKKDQQKNKGDQKKKNQNKQDQKNKNKNGKGDKKKDDKGKPKDNQKNKQGQKKDQQKQQNGKQGQQKQPQEGQGQKRKVQLTPQQVKQLLVALKNKEQKTQKKIKAKILRGRSKKHKQDKDW